MEQSNSIISCWYGFPDNLSSELSDQLFNTILSASEKTRNQRYRHSRDRRLHLMARVMIRTLLTDHFPEVSCAEWAFEQDIHGKPYISGPIGHSIHQLHFNISHTDGLVAVAISGQGPVGVDAENTAREVDYLGLAKRFFAPVEADLILKCDESRRPEQFFRIWTLKEAYVKAIGKGLAHGLDSFWFVNDLGNPEGILKPELYCFEKETGESKAQKAWKCFSCELGSNPRWQLSMVAAQAAETNNEMRWELRHFDAEYLESGKIRKP